MSTSNWFSGYSTASLLELGSITLQANRFIWSSETEDTMAFDIQGKAWPELWEEVHNSYNNTRIRLNRLMMRSPLLKTVSQLGKKQYECPICRYVGAFVDTKPYTGARYSAICPQCRSQERHRLQCLVMQHLKRRHDFGGMHMLHVAPEPFFEPLFQSWFGSYTTTDLNMDGVDVLADLCDLHFEDGSYDVVFASHVLEHIEEDVQALKEIRRILRPGGMAILPVPVVRQKTVEYQAPNEFECGHVRAPGLDYFDKYRRVFDDVDLHTSDEFPDKHQVYILEDRSKWPLREAPHRAGMPGRKHIDIVPVCTVFAQQNSPTLEQGSLIKGQTD